MLNPVSGPEIGALPVPPDTTYSLRQTILGRSPTGAEMRGDVTGWGHYAVIADGAVLATGITHPQPSPAGHSEHRAEDWRIIGMAVDPRHQRQGLGALILAALLTHIRAAGGRFIWCHARVDATNFYRRHGFKELSAEQCDPVAGRQVLMGRQA